MLAWENGFLVFQMIVNAISTQDHDIEILNIHMIVIIITITIMEMICCDILQVKLIMSAIFAKVLVSSHIASLFGHKQDDGAGAGTAIAI